MAVESIFSRFNLSMVLQSFQTPPPNAYDDTRIDQTKSIPDECLALILKFLKTTEDRNNSSLVSHRWLRIEAQNRTHLTLDARSNLQPLIRSIFTRFNSLTQLVLRNNPATLSVSIKDDDIILITSMCPNLTRLKLVACQGLTDSDNCSQLEVLYFSGLFKKWLKERRKLIAHRTKALNASTSDSGVQEHVVEVPPANHEAFTECEPLSATSSLIGNGGPTSIFNDSS